jgi:hypothetical protein
MNELAQGPIVVSRLAEGYFKRRFEKSQRGVV